MCAYVRVPITGYVYTGLLDGRVIRFDKSDLTTLETMMACCKLWEGGGGWMG